MRSHLRIGSGFEYLKAKAEAGNAQARDDLASIVTPQSVFLFEAFLALSNSRSFGMDGPNPICITEIAAYADFIDVRGQSQRHRLLSAVQAMDRAYLEFKRG